MKTALEILFWLDVFGLNVLAGYWIYKNFINNSVENPQPSMTVKNVDGCGIECRAYIDQVLSAKNAVLITPTPSVAITLVPTIKISPSVTPKLTAVKRVNYISILGNGGSNSGQEWIDVPNSDFYLDLKDYPGFIESYFESNMQLINGSGMAYVRIYDVTHGIGVQGSDVSTNSNSATIVTSGKLSFWQGNNLYRIQVRSLTAEVANFLSGRIRIVTAN